jgi:hypothetical protein
MIARIRFPGKRVNGLFGFLFGIRNVLFCAARGLFPIAETGDYIGIEKDLQIRGIRFGN